MTSPENLAAQIAVLLDRDPAMASKVKNYLSEARLAELLQLPRPITPNGPHAITTRVSCPDCPRLQMTLDSIRAPQRPRRAFLR